MTNRFRLDRPRDARMRERDVNAELRFHLEERVEELVARGVPRPDAERQVRERFGDVAVVRAECEAIDAAIDRRRSRGEQLSAVGQQLRLALRSLMRRPSFASVSVLTLAIGCAAVTAAYALVDTVLLRPLPFRAPEELVTIGHTAVIAGKPMTMRGTDAAFLHFEREAKTLSALGTYRLYDVNVATTGGTRGTVGGDAAERILSASVSASLFPTLGVQPALGRAFLQGEDRKDGGRVVIVSDAFWRRKLGGDPSAIGRTLVVHGVTREIVGVMPAGFTYPSASTQLWVPASFDPATAEIASFNWTLVGRMRDGTTPDAVTRELDGSIPRLPEVYPGDIPAAMWAQAQVHPQVIPLRDAMVGDVRRLLWLLLASAALVLVVACANVAGLFVVRAEDGQHELAVRRALGAGTAASLSQFIGESVLVVTGGGALGVALAAATLRAMRLFPGALDIPRLAEVGIDARIVVFVLVVLGCCVVALSILPLLRARGISVASVLKEAGRGSTAGMRGQRARNGLVVAQVAMSMILMSASGLMARSVMRLREVAPGFGSEGVLTMRVALPAIEYAEPEARVRFFERLQRELSQIPGARAVGLTSWVPLTDDHDTGAITVEGLPIAADEVPPVHEKVYVTDSLLRAMGTPILEGRAFQPIGPSRASNEVLVSAAFAKRYWPGESALGKRLHTGLQGPMQTVVGVVGDVHLKGLQLPAEEAVYFPLLATYPGNPKDMEGPSAVSAMIRTEGDAGAMLRPAREAIRRLDPSLPTFDERPLAEVVRDASARMRLTFALLGAASLVTLLLGAVGIYGVLAYGVSLRKREFGVRLALGATPGNVRRSVASQGVRLAIVGVGIGLVVSLAAMRLIAGLLYGVSPRDPATLGATCALLVAVAWLASWLPARRAGSMAPVSALRGE